MSDENRTETPRFKEGSAASWMWKYRSVMDALSDVLSRETASNEAKDAEIARLKAQRDRLLLTRHREGVASLQYRLSRIEAERFMDGRLMEEFNVRIVGGQVEEVK